MTRRLSILLLVSAFALGAPFAHAAEGDAVKSGKAKEFGREAELDKGKQKYGREAELDKGKQKYGREATLDKGKQKYGRDATLDKGTQKYGREADAPDASRDGNSEVTAKK